MNATHPAGAAAARPASKKEGDLRLIVTLTLVCAISAGFLTGVYALTKDRIELVERMKILRAVQEVLPDYANEPDTEFVRLLDGRAVLYPARDAAGAPVGYAVSSTSSEGYGGDIVMMVGVLPDGSISDLKVVACAQETPGLGVKIREESFLDQFRGKGLDGFRFAVTRDGGDVDSITAATISSRAAADAIAQALEAVRQYQENPPAAPDGEEAGS